MVIIANTKVLRIQKKIKNEIVICETKRMKDHRNNIRLPKGIGALFCIKVHL